MPKSLNMPGLLIAILALVGCRGPVVATYDAAGDFARDANGLRLGSSVPEGSLSPAWVLGDGARRGRFERTTRSGDVVVVRELTRDGRRIEIVTEAADGDGAASRTTLEAFDGGLRMVAVESGGVTSVFEPGAIFVPDRLDAGERLEESFGVVSDGRGLRAQRGTGEIVVEGLGTQRVATPAGVFEAFVFRWEMNLRVGVASIRFAQTAWVDRNVGLVAEIGDDRVTVFGIPTHREERVGVLAEELP